MENLRLDISYAINNADALIDKYTAALHKANADLENGTNKGNDFLGWLKLPNGYSEQEIEQLQLCANRLRNDCEIVVTIGIGGSYLGAKAVIEALNNQFDAYQKERKNPIMFFAGQNLSQDYLYELTNTLKGRQFGIICISKSGTTTEPAIAFRILKAQLEEAVGKEVAQKRIVCITDRSRGALRTLANREGYDTFVIEDSVGGRYSVLSPVGLLPIAVAGYDIKALLKGAADMQELTSSKQGCKENIAEQYVMARHFLNQENGIAIELLANFNPKLHYIAEWWKQLYGESEGKEGKGIFPASVDFTTDLHSMGQYIQDGPKNLIFETVISVEHPDYELYIEEDADNLDGLNYLKGKSVDFVNKMAQKGTRMAHVDGGRPNIEIIMPAINEYYLGQLFFFFEKACGISGYMLDVNPFDQPGVEAYKKNMFALLGKPK